MSELLRPDAAREYGVLTQIAFDAGVIDWTVLQERLDFLRELVGEPDPDAGGTDSSPPGSTGEREGGAGVDESKQPPDSSSPSGAQGGPGRDDIPIIHFIPGGAISHLKKWNFHKGDQDPFPSVPHGHWEGRRFPKLDPYLGWVCEAKQRRARRLPKSDTRALWNDERFREFAAAALVHFIAEQPWHDFRVPHPMRLPRRYR